MAPLVVSCFPDLTCSVGPCVAVFALGEATISSRLYGRLQDRNTSYQPYQSRVLRLSQTFPVDTPAPHFWFLLGGTPLRLGTFSQPHKARLAVDNVSSALPRVLLDAPVCVLPTNSAESGQHSAQALQLLAKIRSPHPVTLRSTQQETGRKVWEGV